MTLAYVTLVVPDYDEAADYFTSVFGFVVREDRHIPEEGKRWMVIAASYDDPVGIVLGRARDRRQSERVGDQTGGRVFLFLHADNLQQELETLTSRGVLLVRGPVQRDFGTVAVVEDRYGNWWDLVQPAIAEA